MSERKGGAGFKTIFFAGAVGTVLGILYAPRRGAETRRMLSEKLQGLPSAIEENQVTFREAMIDLRTALKNEAEMKRKQLQQLVGIGKEAASETRANLQAEFAGRAGGPPPGVAGAGGPPPWVTAGAGGPPPGVTGAGGPPPWVTAGAGGPPPGVGGRPSATTSRPTETTPANAETPNPENAGQPSQSSPRAETSPAAPARPSATESAS